MKIFFLILFILLSGCSKQEVVNEAKGVENKIEASSYQDDNKIKISLYTTNNKHLKQTEVVSNFLSLKDIGYGEITGFKGINCYHDWRPYYKGSSKTYSNDELEKMTDEKVTYNGKQITKYEAKQIQRSIERKIRQDKKNIAGLQGVLTSTTNNNKLIEETRTELAKKTLQYNTHKRELDGLIEQISSKKDNTRLFIVEKYDINPITVV